MLLLDAASKLQLTASVAGSIDYTVSKVRNASPNLAIPTKGNIAVATAADICAVPGGSDVDTVESITINNVSSTVTTDITVNHVGGSTVQVFKVAALAPGERIVWNESGVLFVYAVDGSVKSSSGPGRFLRRNFLQAGTAYTVGTDCNKIKVTAVGGGGAGAGCTSLASAASAGGGGGAGAKAEKTWDVSPGATFAYAIGAAGVGASGAVGGNGGNTTFTGPGGVVLTAPGGVGGPVATALTTLSAYKGGDGGALATNGDHNKGGNPGGNGVIVVVATPLGASGSGGSGVYGDGGLALSAAGNGNAATGNGGGGGGAMTGASAVRTGGNGSIGLIVVEEYA